MRGIGSWLRDRHGATSIEYGLICALIVIAMFAGLSNFGAAAIRLLNNVSTAVVNHA